MLLHAGSHKELGHNQTDSTDQTGDDQLRDAPFESVVTNCQPKQPLDQFLPEYKTICPLNPSSIASMTHFLNMAFAHNIIGLITNTDKAQNGSMILNKASDHTKWK